MNMCHAFIILDKFKNRTVFGAPLKFVAMDVVLSHVFFMAFKYFKTHAHHYIRATSFTVVCSKSLD